MYKRQGIGDEKALKVLRKIRETFDIPIVTDIHSAGEAAMEMCIRDRRRATARSYVRSSPITPTLCTGSKITPACHT